MDIDIVYASFNHRIKYSSWYNSTMDRDELPRRLNRSKRSDRSFNIEREQLQHLARRAVASAEDEGESLYEQLLRHHQDNNLDDSEHEHQHDAVDAASIQSEEDRKLPAISPQEAQGLHRRPISLPFSRSQRINESEIYPHTATASEFRVDDPWGDENAISSLESVQSMLPGEGTSTPLEIPDSHRSSRSALFRQSSFYKAALEAAGDTDWTPTTPANDLKTDELLARELEELLQAPPPEAALDEELARAFQAAQEPLPPANSEEQDVALALELMQQEQEQQQRQRQYQQQRQYDQTLSDEELALKLSKELTCGRGPRLGDEMLALHFSQFEGGSSRSQGPPKMVPEQLLILERIQQDKERELIQKAIMESSLHEVPGFMEPPDTRVGVPFSGADRDEDYRFSQELALREWTAVHGGQRTAVRSGLSPTFRSSPSGNTGDLRPSFSREWSQQVEPPGAPRSHVGRSGSVNFIPGRAVAVDTTGRETSIDPRPHIQHISVASTRASLPIPREHAPLETRSRSFEPAIRPTILGGRSPEFRHKNDHARTQQSSLASPGSPGVYHRRGNEETQVAIATGRAHVVICQGCRTRLHAPKRYSLVLCPSCNIISPGLSADGEGDNNPSRGGRGGRDGHLKY